MHRLLEDRSVEDKTVKFAVFAARIGARRQVFDELSVNFAPGKGFGEGLEIHADDDGAKAQLQKRGDQFAGVALPDGKDAAHAYLFEILLAIDAQVFQEIIAEG